MNAADIMIANVITVDPDTSVADTADLLLKHRISGMPVVDKTGQLVGLVSEGDLLFIDSSHTVRPGGDVNFLVLEVLPRLKPGVIVHIHDIFLPYDYQRDTCETFFHWTETSLVRAYMTHNPKVEILACMSHLHYARAQGMQQVFPDYVPQANDEGLQPAQYSPTSPAPGDFPCSLYLITK